MSNQLTVEKFKDIDLEDVFFDSLKEGYEEFPEWFGKKAEESAYLISDDQTGAVNGFVYVKVENGPIVDVQPPMPAAKRLKVGTLKINAHGTKLGERVVKKIFDSAAAQGVAEIYVTVFPTHVALISLLTRYGFVKVGTKTTKNGVEDVLLRKLDGGFHDIVKDYPLLSVAGKSKFLLAIYPDYHTKLLPDSILHTEKPHIVEDVSPTNTIHKLYVGSVSLTRMSPGDLVVMYRTSDKKGPAYYRSVATSVCVVQEVKGRKDFASAGAFADFAAPHSVFSREELLDWYNTKPRLSAALMTYNAAFRKRPTRGELLNEVGISESPRWDLRRLTDAQFSKILELGKVDEGLIVD